MDISIIIPIKNGGDKLDEVLKKIFNQKTNYKYEVILIDSGSTDNTLSIVEQYKIRLYHIPKEDFGHGKTRAYGASLSTAKFIVFLTQDAEPVNEFWLEHLVNACSLRDDVVASFGAHLPYEDCNPFDKRDIIGHFKNFGNKIDFHFMEDEERYKTDEGYKHFICFFSDNNSCIRKEVFDKYPYEDVDFAEDQIWARSVIEMKMKIAYTPYSVVYHSHNYDLKTYFKRYFDEYKGIYEVYQYKILKSWVYIVPAIIKHYISDRRYIKHYVKENTNYWNKYAFQRNTYRYVGGYLGSNYHRYPQKLKSFLDRNLSQQYMQRNK